jgi:hypothetical protein
VGNPKLAPLKKSLKFEEESVGSHSTSIEDSFSNLRKSPIVLRPRQRQCYKIIDTDDEKSYCEDEQSKESELVDPDAVDLGGIARSMFEEPRDPNVSEEEHQMISTSTVNTKRYEKGKQGIENRFFDTIDKFGRTQMKQLLHYTMGTFVKERLFYVKLRGEPTEEKRFVLNKCLVLIVLKWRNNCKTRPGYGGPLQPSTWETLLKNLFAVFKKKNIQFNFATDFNGDGEYHAVLKAQGKLEMEKDPKFGTGIMTSSIDVDADKKIRDKFNSGEFNPFSSDTTEIAYDHRRKFVIFILGRYFFLRGRTEMAYVTWDMIKFQSGTLNGNAVDYVECMYSWDKTHQCSVTNPVARDALNVAPRLYANPNDELCPHRFLMFYRTLCAPTQVRLLCQAASKKALNSFKANNLPYLYKDDAPVGVNKCSELVKELCKEMGFKDWERSTGHSLRKMAVTTAMSTCDKNVVPYVMKMARHKTYQTTLRYQLPNDTMLENYNRAIIGKHVKSPSKVAEVDIKRLKTDVSGDFETCADKFSDVDHVTTNVDESSSFNMAPPT